MIKGQIIGIGDGVPNDPLYDEVVSLRQQLAEAQAENVKLREAVDAALWNIKCVTCDPDGGVAIDGTDEDRRVIQNALTLMEEALSLPTSTEALKEKS